MPCAIWQIGNITESIKGDIALLRLEKLYYCHLCSTLCKIRKDLNLFSLWYLTYFHKAQATPAIIWQTPDFYFQLLTKSVLNSDYHRQYLGLELGLRGSYHKVISFQPYDSKHKHTCTLCCLTQMWLAYIVLCDSPHSWILVLWDRQAVKNFNF